MHLSAPFPVLEDGSFSRINVDPIGAYTVPRPMGLAVFERDVNRLTFVADDPKPGQSAHGCRMILPQFPDN